MKPVKGKRLGGSQPHGRIGDGRRAARLVVDERDLADAVAACTADEGHAAGLEPQPSVDHQIDRVALLAFFEERRARLQIDLLETAVDLRHQRRRHGGQQLGGSEEFESVAHVGVPLLRPVHIQRLSKG